MNINQVILTALIGLITGALGSLFAPWVNWGIEKRRFRFEYRKKVINDIKELATNNSFDRVKIINSSSYKIIRDFLSENTIKELEKPLNTFIIQMGNSAIDHERKGILDDIARLEKKWKIV